MVISIRFSLGGEWKAVWNGYISSLEHGRILLKHSTYILLWTQIKRMTKSQLPWYMISLINIYPIRFLTRFLAIYGVV